MTNISVPDAKKGTRQISADRHQYLTPEHSAEKSAKDRAYAVDTIHPPKQYSQEGLWIKSIYPNLSLNKKFY